MIEYDQHRIWAGGFFEAGGSIMTGKTRSGSFPLAAVNDKVRSHIVPFSQLYDFSEPKENRKTWRSRASGQSGLDFLSEIDQFAPSRREVINVLRNWYSYSPDIRSEICDLMPDIRRVLVPYTAYDSLVKMPSFVAGVLDSRGGFYHLNSHDPEHFQLVVVSQNKGLINALGAEYGGQVYASVFATRYDPAADHRSWTWRVCEQAPLEQLIDVVGPIMRNQDLLERVAI